MPDDPKTQAVLYGPIVLAGDLGTSGLAPELIVGVSSPQIRKAGAIEIPPLKWQLASGRPIIHWLSIWDGTTLMPLSRILDRRYTVYWQAA